MNDQDKRLKRGIKEMGLDALLSEIQVAHAQPDLKKIYETTPETIPEKIIKDSSLLKIPLTKIVVNPEQPRKLFDEEKLKELSDSIRIQGVIQPILVKPIYDDKYQIIAGERRYRASLLAGLTEIPAIVRNLSDEAIIVMALIENIQRHDLNPIEEARAFQRLVEEFYITHQKVAEMVGKSRVSVTNALRLLSLDQKVRTWLEEGTISVGHAKLLMTLTLPMQVNIATMIVEKALSVRETEQLIQTLEKATPLAKSRKTQDPDIIRLQNQLSEKLGASVIINHGLDGKGKLVISYHTLDELEGILAHIT